MNRYLKWAHSEAANVVARYQLQHPEKHVSQLYEKVMRSKGHQKAIGAVGRQPAELGALRGKEIAALVGRGPVQSGQQPVAWEEGDWGGRAVVKAALYMATVAATRWNPVIREFYLRLVGAGKPVKVALVACMKKLLVILNAIVRDGRPWRYSSALT